MTDDFGGLYDFNRWANAKMFGDCRQLTAEQMGRSPFRAGTRSAPP